MKIVSSFSQICTSFCEGWDIVTSCRRKPIGNTSSTGCDRHKYIHNAHCTQHTKQTVQYNHTLYSAHYTEHTSQYTLINWLCLVVTIISYPVVGSLLYDYLLPNIDCDLTRTGQVQAWPLHLTSSTYIKDKCGT